MTRDLSPSRPVSTEPPLLTRPFLWITAAHLLQGLGYASMLLLPLFLVHLEATRSEIGAIMASASVGGILFRPLVGWALDHVGRKPTIVAGTLVCAVGMGLIGLVDRVGPLVYLARFIIGVGVGALFTAYFTLASDVVPVARRTEGIALFGISGLLPLLVNPFAASLGIEGAEIGLFIPVVALIMVTSLLCVARVPEPEPTPRTPSTLRDALGALALPSLRPVWVATATFASLVSIFFVFATVAAESKGMEMPSKLWMGYALAAAGIRLFGARLPDRVGPHNLITPAIGCYVVAALVISTAESEASFHFAAILGGLAHGTTFPVLVSQVVTRSPNERRGAAMAFYTGLWDVCSLTIAPLAGLYADAFGDSALFLTAAAAGAASLVLWAFLEHRWGESGRPGLVAS